ncbi:MAG: glycosyltransferase [Sphingomonadales bacterium]|nr:glycosyltransferase [Sphingomonadales bacterium]
MAERAGRVGIIAIGRNEGDRLRRCLTSIDVPGAPVIYVDSGSTDGSSAMARALGAQVVDLDMTRPFTAARARNAGLEALVAAHPALDYVQFVDGDCEFEPGWIDAALRFLDGHPDVAVVCGRRRERHPEASFYNRLCDAEWNTPVGEARACGGDALMRRQPLVEMGGYDPAVAAGEEPELCHRLRAAGWRIWRIDAAMTIHDAAMHRFRQWWLRAVRSGLGYAQAWRMTWGRPDPLYRRETLRALGWTLGVAAVGVLAGLAIDARLVLLAPLIWGLQFARLARRCGLAEAALLLLGKAAETRGILTFAWRALRGRAGGTVFYK